MGTQVLRPQDCLSSPVATASFSRRRSCNYGNSYSNPRISHNSHRPARKQQTHQQQPPASPDKLDRRRRAASEPLISKRPSSEDLRASDAGRSGLVMEKVTILRRGESFDSKLKNQPAPAKNRVRSAEFRYPVACGSSDVYAGSAFAFSPEPSSLPLPSFSKKTTSVDDSATRDLRRLLRLD